MENTDLRLKLWFPRIAVPSLDGRKKTAVFTVTTCGKFHHLFLKKRNLKTYPEEKMDDLDLALIIYLEDDLSPEEENSRMEQDDLFKARGTEGAFEILVRHRLQSNEEKFREYFHLTPLLFDYVLNHIRDDLSYKPYNRHTKPISPEQKLCILVSYSTQITDQGCQFFKKTNFENRSYGSHYKSIKLKSR